MIFVLAHQAPPVAPWWSSALGGALLASVVATLGWLVVHFTSKSRDRENWRRTTLSQAVIELISLSDKRKDKLRANQPSDKDQREKEAVELHDSIKTKILNIRICANGTQVEKLALELGDIHDFSSGAILGFRGQTAFVGQERVKKTENAIRMHDNDFITLHHNLIRATQKELKLRVDGSFDPA